MPDGDPYVKFKVTHDMDKEYNYKKKNIKSNKNPDFNYEETIHVDEVNERNIKIIRIMTTVMNYNFTIDTTFGGVTTSLTDLFVLFIFLYFV